MGLKFPLVLSMEALRFSSVSSIMNYHTNVSNKFHEYNQEKKKKMQAEGLDL